MIPHPRGSPSSAAPNVGKSTLFNRICGRRKAITDGRPGLHPRPQLRADVLAGRGLRADRHAAACCWAPTTRCWGPPPQQAELAIDEADRVRARGRRARGPAARRQGDRGRSCGATGKPVMVAVNKVERQRTRSRRVLRGWASSAWSPISAEHGHGSRATCSTRRSRACRASRSPESEAAGLRIALVGRPNVGQVVAAEPAAGQRARAWSRPIPGTTRDAVDSLLERGGERYLLVDTAGIRRERLLKENVDHVSVVQARRAIERADVAMLVLDADEGLREWTRRSPATSSEAGRGVVIAVNKWDLAREQRAQAEGVRAGRPRRSEVPGLRPDRLHLGADGAWARDAARRPRPAWSGGVRARASRPGSSTACWPRPPKRYAPKAGQGRPAGQDPLRAPRSGSAPPTFRDLPEPPRRTCTSPTSATSRTSCGQAFGFEGAPIVLKVRTRKH